VDFAEAADDGAIRSRQANGVEAALAALFLDELRKPQCKSDSQPARGIEQGLRLPPRDFGLIEGVDFARIVELPTRKKRGQRHFGEYGEFRACCRGSFQQMHQAPHRLSARSAALNRTGLACSQG
jgi:hypothetical protein